MVDQSQNAQNDHWLTFDPSDVPPIMKTKHSQLIMMLGVVSSDGKAMLPHWFKKRLRLNATKYLNILKEIVKP